MVDNATLEELKAMVKDLKARLDKLEVKQAAKEQQQLQFNKEMRGLTWGLGKLK